MRMVVSMFLGFGLGIVLGKFVIPWLIHFLQTVNP